MAQTVLHTAASRGGADHGWLKSYHTFSFASYYNPERVNFGALRVLNDDAVDGGRGFGEHPHDNMEIISIPLSGALEHKDSMGNIGTIEPGEIQVMSAGTGMYHTEYNKNKDQRVKFLQIWVFPNKRNVEPRYDQVKIDTPEKPNTLVQILSPNPEDAGVWIHQDAWFNLGKLEKGSQITYSLQKKGNGAYIFVLEGDIEINGQPLSARDGFGIWDTDSFSIEASAAAEFLIMDVPMEF
ncbi:Pirin [Pedobacter cryoconitis]|uniref:Pirin n=1 Tax=Pedobacter cryoconitis TaxID=188932 RepID=A0A127VAR9_9SPHI|nr:pirin family protein [Pedobacter cryoconitis]AMP98319.1 Pirin [Pedobacter cryoconitis]